jgi:hypothetical protein
MILISYEKEWNPSTETIYMVHRAGAYPLFQWHEMTKSISTPPGQDVRVFNILSYSNLYILHII